MSIRKRLRSAEVANGYPGFPYHHATTEDLSQRLDRFVLRRVPELPGVQYQVIWYRSATIPAATFNKRPRTWMGRLWKSWNR